MAAIEDGYADDLVNGRPPERAFYLLSYLTSGHRVLHLAGQEFKSVAELTGYMQALLNRGYEHLVAFCHALIDYDCRLDMQLECWLTALGCGAQLELWRDVPKRTSAPGGRQADWLCDMGINRPARISGAPNHVARTRVTITHACMNSAPNHIARTRATITLRA